MFDIILETVLDTVKIIPFLFVAFLIIELTEHKLSKKSKNIIEKSGRFTPILASLLGAIPQCGFSVMATNLYATRVITLGTLISIYLSTSDEMLPILLSNNVPFYEIFKILLTKVIIGMVCGIIIDLIVRKKSGNINYDICEHDNCECKKGILFSAIKHTLKIVVFILITLLILNISFEYLGENFISNLLLKDKLYAPLITSLIGLIPNCASSVILTELYLSNMINFSSLISGLLTGSGVSILVLFKENKNIKENLFILFLLYSIGSFAGLLFEIYYLLF